MNQYQWYPGHMTKARRMMEEDIRLVDLVIELLDARIPTASRNPDIDRLAQGKSRMVLLNKADLAAPGENDAWKAWFEQQGIPCICLDSRSRNGMKQIMNRVQDACREKLERDRRRGIVGRPIRAMVAGIPNVGKSTFINSFAGKACAKTGNKPGVTKGKQWIRLNKQLELLDTPGILWPKFEDQAVGEHLAMIGSMNDQVLNQEELALSLAAFLSKNIPGVLEERYPDAPEADGGDMVLPQDSALPYLFRVAQTRQCLAKGGEYDLAKASRLLLEDFREGRLGRITIERCSDGKKEA